MSLYLIIGALIGLLVTSTTANGLLWYFRHTAADSWRARARTAEDARKAAELRSAEQIDAMLDRVSTSPRLEVASPRAPAIDPLTRKYIPDTPESDEAWNEWRGEPDEDSQ